MSIGIRNSCYSKLVSVEIIVTPTSSTIPGHCFPRCRCDENPVPQGLSLDKYTDPGVAPDAQVIV